jgi:hypothetical protein
MALKLGTIVPALSVRSLAISRSTGGTIADALDRSWCAEYGRG